MVGNGKKIATVKYNFGHGFSHEFSHGLLSQICDWFARRSRIFSHQFSVTDFSHEFQSRIPTRSRIRDRFKFVTERGQSQVGIRDTPLSRIRDRFFSDGVRTYYPVCSLCLSASVYLCVCCASALSVCMSLSASARARRENRSAAAARGRHVVSVLLRFTSPTSSEKIVNREITRRSGFARTG